MQCEPRGNLENIFKYKRIIICLFSSKHFPWRKKKGLFLVLHHLNTVHTQFSLLLILLNIIVSSKVFVKKKKSLYCVESTNLISYNACSMVCSVFPCYMTGAFQDFSITSNAVVKMLVGKYISLFRKDSHKLF